MKNNSEIKEYTKLRIKIYKSLEKMRRLEELTTYYRFAEEIQSNMSHLTGVISDEIMDYDVDKMIETWFDVILWKRMEPSLGPYSYIEPGAEIPIYSLARDEKKLTLPKTFHLYVGETQKEIAPIYYRTEFPNVSSRGIKNGFDDKNSLVRMEINDTVSNLSSVAYFDEKIKKSVMNIGRVTYFTGEPKRIFDVYGIFGKRLTNCLAQAQDALPDLVLAKHHALWANIGKSEFMTDMVSDKLLKRDIDETVRSKFILDSKIEVVKTAIDIRTTENIKITQKVTFSQNCAGVEDDRDKVVHVPAISRASQKNARNILLESVMVLLAVFFWSSRAVSFFPSIEHFIIKKKKYGRVRLEKPKGFCTMKIVFLLTISGTAITADFCSLNNTILQECQDPMKLFSAPVFLKNQEIGLSYESTFPLASFQPGNGTDFECTINGVKSSICEAYVKKNETNFVNCDENFAQQRGCTNEPRSCFCRAGTNFFIMVNKDYEQVTLVDIMTFGIERTPADVMTMGAISHQVGNYNHTYHYSKKHQRLEYRTNNPDLKDVIVRKASCYKMYQSVKTQVDVDLGYCFRTAPGPVKVTIKDKYGEIDRHSFRMEEMPKCDMFPAIFSSETNFNCHSTEQQAAYVIILISFGMSVIFYGIMMSLLLVKMVMAMKKYNWKESKLAKRIKNIRNKNKSKVLNEEEESSLKRKGASERNFNDEIIDMKDNTMDNTEPKRRMVSISSLRKKATVKTGGNKSILCLLLICVVSAKGCDIFIFTDAQATSCNTNTITNQIECVINELISIMFQYAGQVACLNIQSNTNSTIVMYKIELTYVKIYLESQDSYNTADFNIDGDTVLHCKITNDCDTGVCGTLNYNADRSLGGEVKNPNCLAYPGFGGCEVHATTDPLKCGSENNCYYWCRAILPTTQRTTMFEIGSYRYRTKLTVRDADDNPITEIEMGDQAPTVINDIELNNLGLESIDFENILPSYYNIYNETEITSGSTRGLPEEGKIGDIQSNTMEGLDTGDFIYSNNILISHTKDDATDDIIVVTAPPGWRNTNAPKIMDGDFVQDRWNYNADMNTWETDVTRTVGLSLSILFPDTLVFSEQINQVCPKVDKVSPVIGCYDCDSGFSFNITAFSQCLSGSAVLSCDGIDIQNPLVDLIDSERGYEIFAKTKDEKVKTTCYLGEDSFDLNGELYPPSDFNKSSNNLTISNDDENKEECTGDFLSRTFNGCGSWEDILYTILFLIMVAVGGTIGLIIAAIIISGLLKIAVDYALVSYHMRGSGKPKYKKQSIYNKDKHENLERKYEEGNITRPEMKELLDLRKAQG